MYLVPIAFLSCWLGFAPQGPGETVRQILATMDKASTQLTTLSVKWKMIDPEGKLAEHQLPTGVVRLVRLKNGEFEALVEMRAPQPKMIHFHDKKIEVYDPKSKEAAVTDLREEPEYLPIVDVLALVMFGTSGKRLATIYEITSKGTENVARQPTTKLELVPKSEAIRESVKKVVMWVPHNSAYPVRHLVNFMGAVYSFEYSDFALNPGFDRDSLRLPVQPKAKG